MSAVFRDLKGVSVMKDRKFFEKATDVRCETESFFHIADREVGDSPHRLCVHDWLVY